MLFRSKPVVENNRAYMNFINQYFANYLLIMSMSPGGDKVLSLVNKHKDYNALMDYLGKKDGLQNIQLRELVLLKGLYEVYGNPYFERQMVVDMMDTIKEKTQFPTHKTVASNIKLSITRLDKGAPAPNFNLKDAYGVMHKLSDFRGKYVYLDFWATWCIQCLKEMKVLPGLAEKYGQKVAFINISIDKDFEKKLPENKFLSKFEYVNEELSLINKEGVTVDTKGRRINDEGHYLDEDGNRVDIDGHLLDEDGSYVPQVTYLDDSGKPIRDKKPAKSKAKTEEPKTEPKEEDETES